MATTNEAGTRIYECDCIAFCDGVLQRVSQRTWYNHREHRDDEGAEAQGSQRRRRAPAPSYPAKRRRQEGGHAPSNMAGPETAGASASASSGPSFSAPSSGLSASGQNRSPSPPFRHPTPVHSLPHSPNDSPPSSPPHDRDFGEPRDAPVPPRVPLPGGPQPAPSDAPWRLHTAERFTTPESPIQEIRWAQHFVRLVDEATIDNIELSDTARARLRHPAGASPELGDDAMYSLRLFLDTLSGPSKIYTRVSKTVSRHSPEREIPSLHDIEAMLANLTGVVPLLNDMCVKSCCGFTGPFAELERCPYCNEDRYEWVFVKSGSHPKRERRGRRVFYTIPLGPALQALFRSPEACEKMQYRQQATEQAKEDIRKHGKVPVYTDYVHGSLYLEYEQLKRIRPEDVMVVISGDGLQLLKMKKSDCWIYIWIILDISPEHRYQKRYILPGGFVPGPEHMKNTASFLLPGLQHFNAISKEGLRIWKASDNSVFTSHPFLAFETADGVGLADMNNVTGHRGYMGCRQMGPCKSRRAQDSSHYFPACKCADGPQNDQSNHDDYDPGDLPEASPEDYEARLAQLLTAMNETQLKKLRRNTGISAPTIFLGLSRMFPFPLCLTPDSMHLHGQNITSLYLGLWHGSLDGLHKDDDPREWPWRVLVGDAWVTFGSRLENSRSYLPGSFERAPRNIAEKFNSGYKTWELTLAFYALGVGFLLEVLPQVYYDQYTKLVSSVKLKHNFKITFEEVQEAHESQVEAHNLFEDLYYQRRPTRLNYCRQSMHNLSHGAPEIARIGPLPLLSQYPLERTIGDIGGQVRNFQDDRMYSNFAHIGYRQTQLNALYSLYPSLAPVDTAVTAKDHDLGNSYHLLHRGYQGTTSVATQAEGAAIISYLHDHNIYTHFVDSASVHIGRYARLRLPTGQIVRSLWKEQAAPDPRKIRMARNVKYRLTLRDQPASWHIAEVQYFFRVRSKDPCDLHTHVLAVLSRWGPKHNEIWQYSNKTVWFSQYRGQADILVVDAKQIETCVAMVPHRLRNRNGNFLVEKPGLGTMSYREPDNRPDEDVDRESDGEEE